MVLLSTHNIYFGWEIRKILFCYALLIKDLWEPQMLHTHIYIVFNSAYYCRSLITLACSLEPGRRSWSGSKLFGMRLMVFLNEFFEIQNQFLKKSQTTTKAWKIKNIFFTYVLVLKRTISLTHRYLFEKVILSIHSLCFSWEKGKHFLLCTLNWRPVCV